MCVRCDRAERQVRHYQITLPRRNAILRFQGDVCALCQEGLPIDHCPDAVSFWHVDHDHRCCPPGGSCGRCVRGLLCLPCNATRLPAYERLPDVLRDSPRFNTYLSSPPAPAPRSLPPGTIQAPVTHPATSSTPSSPLRTIPRGTPSATERHCPPGWRPATPDWFGLATFATLSARPDKRPGEQQVRWRSCRSCCASRSEHVVEAVCLLCAYEVEGAAVVA
ncbi:endonuclease VII domain-containing protein [Streptomyces rishiriensis]|uniref:endonuclease VII domain-containing protein n=1 Tax=Streptomyces rishiriensis TaxID=68264 RepID=UPI000D5A1A69